MLGDFRYTKCFRGGAAPATMYARYYVQFNQLDLLGGYRVNYNDRTELYKDIVAYVWVRGVDTCVFSSSNVDF